MSTSAQDPVSITQLDKTNVIAVSAQASELVPIPSFGSSAAPEYAQMVNLVKGAIQSIVSLMYPNDYLSPSLLATNHWILPTE